MGRVGRFLTRVAAASVSFAVSLALLAPAGSGATAPHGMTTQSASRYLGHDVYASLGATDANDGGIYLSDTGGSAAAGVRREDAKSEALPWTVHVTYSLDGPQTDADSVDGASGLIGVRVTVTRNRLASHDIAQATAGLVPVVAFTIPTEVGDDLSSSDGAVIAQHGSDNVVTAIGNDAALLDSDDHSGPDDVLDAAKSAGTAASDDTVLDLSVYLNAKRFSMSPIVLAALPASDANDITAQSVDLAQRAISLADTLTGANGQDNDELIAQLTALRDRERALAVSTIAERTAAHQQAFDAYMAAYVGSYTTHLSGSIGNKTQMTALIGTAGELSGDTPLATAVVDLANAVNAVSAAHRHTGAADEVDAIIRRIRQQGVTGLTTELEQDAGHESQLGSSGYSSGQSQLSQAMIPYSMAYTDTYTEHLSELTGGSVAGAGAHQAQAIAQTNESFATDAKLKADQAKVDAAMVALATASEHTGRAQAIRQLLLRFEDQFEAGDAADSSFGGSGGGSDAVNAASEAGQGGKTLRSLSATDSPQLGVGGNGIAAVVEAARLRKRHEARERAAAAVRRQSQSADGQTASLVDDQVSMSKDDVMSFAGGVASLGGGSGSGSDGGSGGTGGAGGTGAGAQSAGANDGDGHDGNAGGQAASANVAEEPSVAFGIRGMNPGSLLVSDRSATIDETIAIGDAAPVLTSAVTALSDAGSLSDLASYAVVGADTRETRFLLVLTH